MDNNELEIERVIMSNMLLNFDEGKYEDGCKLPSDNELAEKYNVPRMKIRHIYKRLESMGYVYSLQGRGRFFKGKRENIKLVLSGQESFSKKLKEQGYELESKNIFCERIPYNEKIYGELNADIKDEVYQIGRLRIVYGEPVAIHVSYVKKSIFNNIYEDGKRIGSMFKYYEWCGFKNFTSTTGTLSIEYPTLRQQQYLKCGELVPILKLESNCIDKSKNVVLEYTEIMYRGDRFKYQI